MKEAKAEIINIGNEILSGWTVNTNAQWIAKQLQIIGMPVGWMTTIADNASEIESALSVAEQRADVILCTGGLGPTPDDITKKSVAKFFKSELVLNEEILKHIKSIFVGRNLKMPDINRQQAMVPDQAKPIHNPLGTAPGLIFRKKKKYFYFMPGVPGEMMHMMDSTILENIRQSFDLPAIQTFVLRTTGIAESRLYEKLNTLLKRYPDLNCSFLPKVTGVDIKLKASQRPQSEYKRVLSFLQEAKKIIAKYIYSEEQKDLQEIIGTILREKKLSLSTAESFTGGLIADWLTDIPGSSDYYLGSVIAYSNESKVRELGISEQTLIQYGAVSRQTVEEMVNGVKDRFKSDCAIASTGIAGPAGATEKKSVGLCYIAAAYQQDILIKKFNFGINRRVTKERGAIAGLESLRRLLLRI